MGVVVAVSLRNMRRQQVGGRQAVERLAASVVVINRDVEAGLMKLLFDVDLARLLQQQQVAAHPGNL
ncbi:hypothetical protein ACP_1774 [Acidobacterium capsulatum ATCC 51196]|uniref:Uncharacterized protein n=1 Tax=Acidobacterium capsulatum (strain ATCC 51196 / DSM 11244 / BCRC 80197 / JCM 7670 / NBRC 15755 / NCIMB 13165 / 161) TaxID=240015 RepID=C1F7P1_ACIC5|nr:hypothetical protein ACP_1774 [Acidobacterium capsulatum ATCC 51196]